MSSVARGIETNETRGMMKAVVDVKTKKNTGCLNPGFGRRGNYVGFTNGYGR